MRKHLLLLLLAVVTLFACNKQDERIPTLNIPKLDYSLSSIGGVVDIYLQTDVDVTIVVEKPEWIRQVQAKSARLNILSFEYDQNTTFKQRTNKIIVTTIDNKVSEVVTLTQLSTEEIKPVITSFRFELKNNPMLLCDVEGVITPDNVISVSVPYVLENKNLTPTIEFDGVEISIEGAMEDKLSTDFTTPVTFVVKNQSGESASYKTILSINNSLPMLFLETEDASPIVSKDDYVKGVVRLDGNNIVASLEAPMQIKGRGNSTWIMPKKPYRIKFDKKQSLGGFPAHKDWVLLANFSDKSALRTELAFDLSRRTNLAYTPRSQFLDIFINDQYNGTYQLTEQLKIDENRVNVGKDGFLLEVDALDRLDDTDVYFYSPMKLLFCIKDPDVVVDGEDYNWIKDYVSKAENALHGADFKDPDMGYAKYLDVESFADWYLVNEIAKNNDAVFSTSCYLNIKRDGKLAMGPVWDFDIAFGNCNYNGNNSPEGFWNKESYWIQRLFEDPAFVEVVKKRFENLKLQYPDIIAKLNKSASEIKNSQQQNNAKWNTLFNLTWPNYAIWGSYDNEVTYLKTWFTKRMEWLDKEFNKM